MRTTPRTLLAAAIVCATTLTGTATATATAATGPDPVTPASATTAPVPAGTPIVPGIGRHVRPSCTGTGTDGNRVQVLYVRDTTTPSAYAASLATIRNEVATIDDLYMVSARKQDAGRKVRWVHDSACQPVIPEVTLPAGATTGSFATLTSALRAAGYTAADRKYLAFVDAPTPGDETCGLAERHSDDTATGNRNDGTGQGLIARVTAPCWTSDNDSIAGHELTHALGAVQESAPHASTGGHCTDGPDLMCRSTGTRTCQPLLLDCGNDDYFAAAPPAGSYLATHWNVANSSFLDVVANPAGPTLTTTQSTTSADTGEQITFTATTPAGNAVNWRTNAPECVTGSTTAAALTMNCADWAGGDLEVTAYATSPDDGVTARTMTVQMTFSGGPAITVTGPGTVPAGEPFTVKATATGSGPLTYAWHKNARCPFTGGSTDAITATCAYDADHPTTSFTVDVTQGNGDVNFNYVLVKVVKPGAGTPDPIDWKAAAEPGYPTVFTATLRDADTGTPIVGATVALQARWAGQDTWDTVAADLHPDAAGTLAYSHDTLRAGVFRFAVLDHGSTVSTSQTLTVPLPVTLTATKAARHRVVTFTGVVCNGAGQRVRGVTVTLLRQRRGSHWLRVRSATTGTTGIAKIAVTSPEGVYKLITQASKTNTAATSRLFRLD